MGVSALKAAAITSLDASPYVPQTSGEGATGNFRCAGWEYVTVVAADAATSTYKLVRLPTNAKVKHVFFESEAQGAGKVQLSVYYPDSKIDGSPVANQGLIVGGSPGGAAFFSGDIDCASAVHVADYVNGVANAGAYPMSLRNQPLWQALGLASDPGGFFDLVAVVHTTDMTTGTGKLGACVEYVM